MIFKTGTQKNEAQILGAGGGLKYIYIYIAMNYN